MVVTSAGNVGIGITTPLFPLHVLGNTGIGSSLTVTGLTFTSGGLRVNGFSDLTGNVGIGQSLTVGSAVQFSTYNCSALGGGGKLTTDSQGRVVCQADTDTGTTGSGADGQITFWTGSNTLSGNNTLFWNNSLNRLGIGSSAPGARLGVFGSVGIGSSYAFATLPASAANGLVVQGNIGIGTSNPTAPLHIVTSNIGSMIIDSTFTESTAADVVTINVNNITTGFTQRGLVITQANIASTNTTEALLVLDNARIAANVVTDYLLITKASTGPDTTADAIDVSDSDLYNAINVGDNRIAGTTATIDFTNFDVAGNGNVGIGTTTTGASLQVNGGGIFWPLTTAVTGPSNGLAVQGNVGIGTTTPVAPLHIWGNGTNSAFFLNGNVGIGTAGPDAKLMIQGGATGNGLHVKAGETTVTDYIAKFEDQDGTVQAMYIDADGAIGINQTSPSSSYKLDVNGSVNVVNNIQLGDSGTTSAIKVGTFGHIIGRNATDGSLDIGHGQANVNIGRTSVNNLVVYGSGTTCTIGSGTGATNCTSDERLKTNITPISGADALQKLSLINGVTFNWADPTRPQEQQVGIIAQDVMKAFPQIVRTGPTTFMGQEGIYYTVDYAALVSPLIAGVSELNTRVNSILNNNTIVEDFPTRDASIEAGDVVAVDKEASSSAYIAKSNKKYQNDLIGIVSTNPGFRLSQEDGILENPTKVALAGRVPVKVSTENGPIEVGDYLTNSSTPGITMKATRPGSTVGKALEAFAGEEIGKILAFINVSYADPGNFFASLSLDNEGNLIIPKIRTANIILDSSVASASAQLSINNGQLTLNEDPNYNSTGPQLANNNNSYDLAGKIASLEDKVKELEATVSAKLTEATPSAQITEVKLTPPDILLATGSATLANLEVTSEATFSGMLAAYDLKVSNSLKSLGETTLGKTLIAGDLIVDGMLSVTGNSLSNLSTLYLQNSPLAQGLDIFNGKVTINKEGKITASEVQTNKLTILGASIGTATLLANTTTVTIQSSNISNSSKVFITPTTSTDKVLSVTNIKPGESFDVSITAPPAADEIKFNWWIVGTN